MKRIKRKNAKTLTDLNFENYLRQRRLRYQYEPYLSPTAPDYIFFKGNRKILVECEEIEKTPLDAVKTRAGTISIDDNLKVLKRKIYTASKQLKPHVGKVDYSVIVLGKKEGFDLTLNFLYWAMFGDPVVRIPLPQKGKREKPFFDLKMTGQLRRNYPGTKNIHFSANYISGVGLIKKFNGLMYYKNKIYDEIYKKDNQTTPSKDLGINIRKTLDFFERGWERYQRLIPKKYLKNPDKIVYKIEMISNPFSTNPLPRNIVNGRWDSLRAPKVIYE